MNQRIVGWVSIPFGIASFFVWSPVFALLFMAAFFYMANRIIRQKKELTRGELIAMGFLFVMFFLPWTFILLA